MRPHLSEVLHPPDHIVLYYYCVKSQKTYPFANETLPFLHSRKIFFQKNIKKNCLCLKKLLTLHKESAEAKLGCNKSSVQNDVFNVKSMPEWLKFRLLTQKRWIMFACFNNYVYICHTFQSLLQGRFEKPPGSLNWRTC
jgi:hypothetical protein